MATGDAADMARRIYASLPARWFSSLDTVPVLRGILIGLGQGWSFCFDLIVYARQQCRISTATGSFLDMAASDFFDLGLIRLPAEADASFRSRLKAALCAEKATRAGILAAMSTLSGTSATVFEPARPADAGGYGAVDAPGLGGGLGYSRQGLAYGSLELPFQCLVTVTRSSASDAVTGQAGYGDAGALTYTAYAGLQNIVTDDDVRRALLAVTPANAIVWLALR
jgi:hypothetical protein